MLLTGFARADGIAALFVAALMLRAAYMLLRESGRVFLEAAPRGLDPQAIGLRMAGLAGRRPRSTTCTSGRSPRASRRCRRTCSSAATPTATTSAARSSAMLHDEFEIEHTTLQVEHEGGDLLEIEVSPRG